MLNVKLQRHACVAPTYSAEATHDRFSGAVSAPRESVKSNELTEQFLQIRAVHRRIAVAICGSTALKIMTAATHLK